MARDLQYVTIRVNRVKPAQIRQMASAVARSYYPHRDREFFLALCHTCLASLREVTQLRKDCERLYRDNAELRATVRTGTEQ
jgi:hypothetical protein